MCVEMLILVTGEKQWCFIMWWTLNRHSGWRSLLDECVWKLHMVNRTFILHEDLQKFVVNLLPVIHNFVMYHS